MRIYSNSSSKLFVSIKKVAMKQLWFSLYNSQVYESNDPEFLDFSNYKGIKELEKDYLMIFNELNTYLTTFQLEPQFNSTMVETPKSWKVRSLRVWGVEMYDIQKYFPITMNLMSQIPNVINIGFNLLEPDSKIKPHCGDTDANYRCHLGLKIPQETKQCFIKVNGVEAYWEEGKTIAFIDAFEHEAYNFTNEQRIILLFDVLKPQYVEQKNKICATVLTSFYIQKIGNFWQGIYKINRRGFKYIFYPIVLILKLLIPIRNRCKSHAFSVITKFKLNGGLFQY